MRTGKRTKCIARAVVALACLAVIGAQAEASNPEVKIAEGPLLNGRSNVHPNMLLSLSIEFSTAVIAYRDDGGRYNRNNEYVGYFNPLKCYRYNGESRNLADTGNLARDGYFYILKAADPKTHECGGDSFSGNFMNWAASSMIDILRYALTGGDRIYDAADGTILQRAFLPDGFYANSSYFPRRKLTAGGNTSAPSQVTPFKEITTLYIVSCRNRILFSDASSGSVSGKATAKYCTSVLETENNDRNNCRDAGKSMGGKRGEHNCRRIAGTDDAGNGQGGVKEELKDKKLGEYLARVKVCDSNEGAERKDLCHKYGSSYKPVGAIQRHAQRLRLAAMGYLLDDAETRYGGVLRAPMKHLGPKKLEAPDFSETDNDGPEWDPATGVFYRNPENPTDRNSTVANSGVINYLNKFGRSGNYKRHDPVGELYYEGIRYLQGKAPSPEATAGMTHAMQDGFPVITTWVDPVIASCQKNYIVSIADADTHWDRYIPGNSRTKFGDNKDAHDGSRPVEALVPGKTPMLDVKTWTEKVGEMEADEHHRYKNPVKNTSLAGIENKDTGASGRGTYYMAGLAYWGNTNDIRLDKPTRVKTYTIDVDGGGNGLIDGNSRSLQPRNSQLYLAAKYGGFDDKNNDGNPFVTLADDDNRTVASSTVEWDNGNGVPANYFLAGQPREMISSIRRIFGAVRASSATSAGVAVSTTRISSDGGFAYQAGFDASGWGGSLRKLALTLDETGDINIGAAAKWDAGQVLTGSATNPANPKPDHRKIYTSKLDNRKSQATIEFKWNVLDDAQKAFLNTSPVDGKPDGMGENRLAFLRGERSLELGRERGIFRARDRVLADIINSAPMYVGPPALNVHESGYQKFYEDNKWRAKVVYVGANDGMLHAFSADDGKELFAYVPEALIKHLNLLTHPGYAHRPYIDGAIAVAEAIVGERWRTVLASGMGGGAQGVFALDITDPLSFSSGLGAIWEFTDTDDPDMGNVMGVPVIGKFKVPAAGRGFEFKYFLVVSSGLNNYKDDGDKKFNEDAAGALFLLSLDKKASEKWVLGVNYYKFRTATTSAVSQNGLSPPALVVDGGGVVRFAYAGDLQGNLWRFDFTGTAPWSKALPRDGKPLFIANDRQGMRQPITSQPKVVFAPGGGYVVLFGTGKFAEDADTAIGNFRTQSFYGIYDTAQDGYSLSGRGQLASREARKTGSGALQITGSNVSYGSSGNQGWYFDFPESAATGERSVTNPLIADGSVFFRSLVPNKDPCAAVGGRTYLFNALTGFPPDGEATGYLSQAGMLGSLIQFETRAEVSDRNATGKRSVRKRKAIINFGTSGGQNAPGRTETGDAQGTVEPTENGSRQVILRAGRFSWREIVNWQELRNAHNETK